MQLLNSARTQTAAAAAAPGFLSVTGRMVKTFAQTREKGGSVRLL